MLIKQSYRIRFRQVVQKRRWVRWETEWSFNVKLCQK